MPLLRDICFATEALPNFQCLLSLCNFQLHNPDYTFQFKKLRNFES